MKKFILIIIVFFLFPVLSVNAVPAAPSPTCQVTGEIKFLEFIPERYNERTGGMSPSFYYVTLNNLSGIVLIEEGGPLKCDENYLNTIKDLKFIYTQSEYEKTPIGLGQVIKTNVHFTGDEFFSGYFLSALIILSSSTININTNVNANLIINAPAIITDETNNNNVNSSVGTVINTPQSNLNTSIVDSDQNTKKEEKSIFKDNLVYFILIPSALVIIVLILHIKKGANT